MTTIGGVRIVREPCQPPRGPVEHLRYSIDVYDEGDNLIEVLGWVADLAVARTPRSRRLSRNIPTGPSACAKRAA